MESLEHEEQGSVQEDLTLPRSYWVGIDSFPPFDGVVVNGVIFDPLTPFS